MQIIFFRNISIDLSSNLDITRGTVVWNKVDELWFFTVNNVRGRDDSSLTAMLQSIEAVMKQSDYVVQEKPLTWLQAL